MLNFSWRQWLRQTTTLISRCKPRPIGKPRRPNVFRHGSIEGLEERVVLTANLPVAVDDVSYMTNQDQQLTGTSVLANDTDADGDTIDQAIIQNNVQHGTLNLNLDGTFTYMPTAGYVGGDSFTYFAKDSVHNETSATAATVTITVKAVNHAPVANAVTVNAVRDTVRNGTLTASDVDGDALAYFAGQVAPQHGKVTINPNGGFTYTPDTGYVGPDSFTFFVNDGKLPSAEATVTVTVKAVNSPPVAAASTLSTAEDTPKVSTFPATDADGDSLTFVLGQTAAAHGVVTINPNGTYTYAPAENYNGPDSFSFIANDGSANSSEATVNITVTPVNDPPVANDASATAFANLDLNGTLTGSDVDQDVLGFFAGLVVPQHGAVVVNANGTFTYTPHSDYVGPDSFSFFVNDGTVPSPEATVSVTVAPPNTPPVANPVNINIIQNVAYSGTLTATDENDDPLNFAAGAVAPQHGSVIIAASGAYTYTPTIGFTGSDSFSFIANDGKLGGAPATVSITVTGTNVAPIANPDSFTTVEDTPHPGTLTANAPSGSTLTFLAGQFAPSHGSVIINANGSFTYTPSLDTNGADSFSFFVNNGTVNSAEATITVTVTPVNDAPVANPLSIQTNADSPFSGNLTGSDADGNGLTFAPGLTAPAHGSVLISPIGAFIYTPAAGYVGTDSFTFLVNDGTVNSAEGTVSVTVNSFNRPPIAVAASAMAQEDTLVGGRLMGTDQDDDPLTFSAGPVAPAHGTVLIAPNGFFIYTPNPNFNGSDTFSFNVSDGASNSIPANVTLFIAAVNDVPVANAAAITTVDGTPFTGQLTGSDIENSVLTFAPGATSPAHGTVNINPNGVYSYSPTPGYVGPDSFSFNVNDGTATSPDATISVTVKSANHAPVVANGSDTFNQYTVYSGTLATLGSDADANTLTYSVGGQPAHGLLALDPGGTFTFTPTTGFSGTDAFTFKANDGQEDSNLGTFNLTILAVNLPLTLNLPSTPPSISKNSVPVRIDPQATVGDPDTAINFAQTQIQVTIANLPSSDAQNGRVTLGVQTQGSGLGVLKIKGTKLFFNGSLLPLGVISGGTKGKPLVITFSSQATEQSVNAVLQLVTIRASKRATSGSLKVDYQVLAGGQTAKASTTLVVN